MLNILHGDNLVESRQFLRNLTAKAADSGVEVVTFQGNKATLADIKEALASDTLLGGNRMVVIENLLGGQKSAEKTKVISYLKEGKYDSDLLIWEDKEIKGILSLPKAEVHRFRVNQVIFRYLESLRPGNTQETLQLLETLKRQEEAEMVFYMLIRQFRLLIMVKDEALETMAPWQRQKLLNQSRNFTCDELLKIYQELLNIDFKQKTSGDPYPLYSRLDLLMASF